MRVIINASPLIVLFKSGLEDLLPQLCDEVIVPAAVWDEVLLGGTDDTAAVALPNMEGAGARSRKKNSSGRRVEQ